MSPLRAYRVYIAMFLLNLALLGGIVFLLRRDEPRQLLVTLPTPAVTPAAPQAAITVRVSGGVKQPGQYRLDSGASVAHALQKAGGVKPDADLSGIDLTARLEDGATINVPSRTAPGDAQGLAGEPTSTPAKGPGATPARALLNLNTATLEELDTLPGIGPVLAQRIIEYRTLHGGFASLDELKDVRGIGDALYNDLKEMLTLR